MKDYSILLRGGGVTVEIAPEGELCLLENGTEGFGRVDGVVTLAEYAVSGGGIRYRAMFRAGRSC